jgi:hypothetical protein
MDNICVLFCKKHFIFILGKSAGIVWGGGGVLAHKDIEDLEY